MIKSRPITSNVIALVLFFTTLPIFGFCAFLSTLTFETDVGSWPHPTSTERIDFDAYRDAFGSAEVALISWADCTLDSPVLSTAEESLKNSARSEYFQSVTSGQSINRFLDEKLATSGRQRTSRLAGYFVGSTNNLTCLMVKLSRTGTEDRDAAFAAIFNAIESAGVDRNQIHMSGPAVHLYRTNHEGFWSPLRVVPWIAGLSFILCWIFLRQLQVTFFVNQLGVYAGAFSLSLVYLSGTPLSAIVWAMPTLVLLLTTSTALHFLAYYRDAVARTNLRDAPTVALRNAFWPTVFCAGTTSIGLFSLMFSSVRPVFQFGMFGGIAIVFSCFGVLFWLPKWLEVFPYQPNAKRPSSDSKSSTRWSNWATVCGNNRVTILTLSCALLAALAAALPTMKTGVSSREFFSNESQIIKDLNWFESNLCDVNSTEVQLNFQNADASHDRARLAFLLKLQTRFSEWDEFTGAASAGIYHPATTNQKRTGLLQQFQKKARDGQFGRLKNELVNAGLVSQIRQNGSESWLLSLRGPAFDVGTGEQLIDRVKNKCVQEFDAFSNKYFPGEQLSVSVTGHSVLSGYLEKQFLRDLALTYGTAFCLISIVILTIFRSWRMLFISILPNLFPAVVVLGGLAAFGVTLDVASLLTASVALGIAVDDTLHFLLWWRDKKSEGLSSVDAVTDALKHCGVAMLQTSIVFGVGVSLYAFGGFLPTVRFGWLLSGMMLMAIAGDMLLLPALLGEKRSRPDKPDTTAA